MTHQYILLLLLLLLLFLLVKCDFGLSIDKNNTIDSFYFESNIDPVYKHYNIIFFLFAMMINIE
jgi:hypothetical protein